MFQQSDVVGFAVWTDASSDFSGTDMLSLEWNSDSNIMTGTNGADILLNLTSDTLNIYEWTGSLYELSSYTGSFWSSSTNTFLKIEGLPIGVRGDIVLSTHNSSMNYVDSMASPSLTNIWRPMTEAVDMSLFDDNLTIVIDSYDSDSSLSSRSIGAAIVYGNLSILQTSLVLAEDSYELTIDADLARSQYVNSLSFNITSELETFYSPFAMLSISTTDLVRITGATLDSSVIRTGILFSERITGQFSIVGYELISEAQIGFRYSLGFWFNFTITGDGLYEFIITPAGFPAGQYEVYAMAKGATIPPVEIQFATLTIIEDNTLIVVGIGVGVAAVVAIFTFRRYSYRRGVD
jgi:hypothetical protein